MVLYYKDTIIILCYKTCVMQGEKKILILKFLYYSHNVIKYQISFVHETLTESFNSLQY